MSNLAMNHINRSGMGIDHDVDEVLDCLNITLSSGTNSDAVEKIKNY